MIIEVPQEGMSSCRSVGSEGEPMERTCDDVIASRQNQECGSGGRFRGTATLGNDFSGGKKKEI